MTIKKLHQPGDTVTCVVGNRFDAAWCPSAQVLLLATEESYHTTRFLGLAKKPNGDLEVLFHVAERPEGFIADDRGWGDFYCAFSITFKELERTAMSRFLPLIHQSMAYHVAKINAMPAYTEIAGSNAH
jgi:hypothetical protein